MAKNGFIPNGSTLEIWADDVHIANLSSGGFMMVGGKTMAAGTLKGAGGKAVWHAGNLTGTKASKINDTTGGAAISAIDTNLRATVNTIINALEAFGVSTS